MKKLGLYTLSAMFIFTGIAHLMNPGVFEKIVPPFLPFPHAIAILSGIAELLLAVGLLPKKTRRLTAWAVVAFLVCIFPANIYMYMARESAFPDIPAWALLARLPLQFAMMAWAWQYTRPEGSKR
jgi:uncharacterized membrane protein